MQDAPLQATIHKVLWRLIPFVVLCYILNYLDRANIAIARDPMMREIPGFNKDVYAYGAATFFLGYCLFELPSNLIQERVGPRRWIARIMISWGLISMAFMFTAGPRTFYWLRFALGLAEAGFFPGVILYLSHWVPQHYRARTSALFLASTAISCTLGNPLGGTILYLADQHHFLLKSWQWLFLLEGAPTVLLGLFTLFYLTDKPADARWLTAAEREGLTDLLAREQRNHPGHHASDLKDAFTSRHTWILSILYALVIWGFYTLVFYTPTIIRDALVMAGTLTPATLPALGDFYVGLLSAIPFGSAAVGMMLIARHSDKHQERKLHLAFACTCVTVGLALAGAAASPRAGVVFSGTGSTILTITGLAIGAIGAFGIFGPFWALPSQLLAGTAAAAAFAIINSIGNLLGGYLGPICFSRMPIWKGLFLAAGLSLLAAIMAVLAPIPAPHGLPNEEKAPKPECISAAG